MEQLEQLLGREWKISPAGGATGEAFIAVKDNQKLFLKRNSSPFLAVLSAEGIVPKLMWTRRLGKWRCDYSSALASWKRIISK